MDYAFVPGIGDPAIDANRAALNLRPNTAVFADAGGINVAQFLSYVIAPSAINPPGDLIAAAHGSAEGELLLGLDATRAAPTTFEKLVDANAAGSIKIPPIVMAANPNFRLTSCLLGSDSCRPLLQMFKQALGNPNGVSAPKFLHVFASPDGQDYWESMMYDFVVLGDDGGRKPLAGRDGVVGRFGAGAFKFFDGTDVPLELWEKWVPGAANLNLKPSSVTQFSFDFPLTAKSGSSLTIILHATASWLSHLEQTTVTINTNVIPVGQDVMIDMLDEELPKLFAFNQHTYPVYARYHFNTLHDFVRGWVWSVTPNKDTMTFVGTRYKYRLWIPVTKPGTADEWIFNFYPHGGNPTVNFTPATQPKLFGIV